MLRLESRTYREVPNAEKVAALRVGSRARAEQTSEQVIQTSGDQTRPKVKYLHERGEDEAGRRR